MRGRFALGGWLLTGALLLANACSSGSKPDQPEPAPALAYAGVDATPEERKSWGIIEID